MKAILSIVSLLSFLVRKYVACRYSLNAGSRLIRFDLVDTFLSVIPPVIT